MQCAGQPVLPLGLKDEMAADTVKTFCPKCQCVYHPPPVRSRSSHHNSAGAAGVDGAAFGTTFPHLFLMTFSNLVPDRLLPASAYVPRVFGFRVHISARQRTSTVATTVTATAARPTETKVATKRLPFTRRSGTSVETAPEMGSKVGDEDAEGDTLPSNSATNDSGPLDAKAAVTPVGKAVRGEDAKDDESSRKSKSGKRRNDDGGGKPPGNGVVEISAGAKRRRKSDNGNT